jgi:pilus assembly protein CpaF
MSAAAGPLSAEDRAKLKQYLIKSLNSAIQQRGGSTTDEAELRGYLEQAYARTQLQLADAERNQLFAEVLAAVGGDNPPPEPDRAPTATPAMRAIPALTGDYGPIQALLEDPSVTEIMVNGAHQVFVERAGRLVHTDAQFRDDDHVLEVIQGIVKPLGRRIDAEHPSVDARLPDGSRVNAIIPPVAIDGPVITIRKFAKERYGVRELVGFGSISETMAQFLEACVRSHLNIIISGGTGSGKTTLLNMLSSFIPGHERIVTIEDAAELQLQQQHVVRLETKSGSELTEGMDVRALVRNALRMRPDRIVVGEVRGGEALDMLQAMNTGHDGSLTTLHANTPRDAISRLETMVLMAGMDVPIFVARQQIAAAVDLIVQQSRMPDGSRKVTHITEVAGMEGDTVVMTDVFRFEQTGTDEEGKVVGQLQPTGIRPLLMPRLDTAGFGLPASIFMKDQPEDSRASSRRR